MMFFNFSQFFASQGPNALYEEFLKTEGVTLEQLLDHEDTVTEVKKANASLVALLQPQIPRLVEYISKEPSVDAGEKEGRRYPFVASEILCSDAMLGELGKDSAVLPLVFQYLQGEAPLNLTLVGYSASLSLRILERQSFKVFEFLFSPDSQYPSLLLKHIENRAVAELIVSILSINTYLQARTKLLFSVMLAYEQGMKRERAVNVSFVVQETIRRSADVGEWKGLMCTFFFQEVVEKLALAVTWPEVSDLAATVLTAFLSHSAFRDVVAFFTEVCEASFNSSATLLPIAKAALAALTASNSAQQQANSYGEAVPLGQNRLALIQLLNVCVRVMGTELDEALVQWEYVSVCTRLFQHFPWHSGLHQAYESLVRVIVDEGSQTLKSELMEKVDLVSVLSEAGQQASPGEKHRKGYLGYITRIANTLLSASASFPYFRQHLDSDMWTAFASSYLLPQNRIETSKYFETSRKESEISSDVQPIEDTLSAAEREEVDNEEGFEFQVTQSTLPAGMDRRNASGATAPEREETDVYNDFNYWKMPVGEKELEELE